MAGLYDPWDDAPKRDGVSLKEAVERYLRARRDRRPKTQRADRGVLMLFRETLAPGIKLQHVKEHHARKFLETEELSDSSKNTYHTRLKSFFKWCAENGLLRENPMRKMKPPKAGKKVAEYLSREEYEQLLRCIEADAVVNSGRLKEGEVVWVADVVKFAVGTGLRLSEICNLRWSAINLSNGQVTVKNTADFKTKSGHERVVFVYGDAREVLERLHAGRTSEADDYVFQGTANREGTRGHLNPEYVSKRFLHYARMAKLPKGIHFHSLRHTYASWLVMAGVDLFRVKELLGHADISTTMRYAHLAPKAFQDELQRVFG